MALTTLLPRTQAAGRREKGDAAAMIIDHPSGHDNGVDDKAAAMQLGASAAHPIIIDADEDDRAGLHGREQPSTEKVNVALRRSQSRSVQSAEYVMRQIPPRVGRFVHQPEAGPSQPRYRRELMLCVTIELP